MINGLFIQMKIEVYVNISANESDSAYQLESAIADCHATLQTSRSNMNVHDTDGTSFLIIPAGANCTEARMEPAKMTSTQSAWVCPNGYIYQNTRCVRGEWLFAVEISQCMLAGMFPVVEYIECLHVKRNVVLRKVSFL